MKFNKKIYPKQSIRAAVTAYSDIARFDVASQKEYTEVRIKDVDPEVGAGIADEFANYVLSEARRCL